MKPIRNTLLLLALTSVACVSPSASVSDLTGKSLEGGNALAEADREKNEAFREFVTEVEQNELALLKEMRRKIERLTVQAMREKVDARRAQLKSHFDAKLWQCLTEDFADLVKENYDKPFQSKLSDLSAEINEIYSRTREFPNDNKLRSDLDSTRSLKVANERTIQLGKLFLQEEASRALVAARRDFDRELDRRFTPYEDLLVRADRQLDESFSSILTHEEVERAEPQPISYDEHLAALGEWNEHTQDMHASHLETLETIDRYMKGREVTLLFLEGVFEDKDLVLPPPPTVKDLGLSELVVELRDKEVGLEQLMSEVDATVELSLLQVTNDLATLIKAKRREVEATTQF